MKAGAEPEFELVEEGERVAGIAAGVDRAHLRKLKRGEVPIGRSVDLHGLHRREAGELVKRELREAHARGVRCVVVIHGRGTRSEEGPVLRRALLGWLRRPPLAALVLAFASALPRDGGAGATYVLLRRAR